MTTMDMQATAQNLEAAGADPRLAAAVADGLAREGAQRHRGPVALPASQSGAGVGAGSLPAVRETRVAPGQVAVAGW